MHMNIWFDAYSVKVQMYGGIRICQTSLFINLPQVPA
jgi:hypothetical protein